MNRQQRRAMEKAEKKGKVFETPELSEAGKLWIQYGKDHGVDFNAWFIMFSAWLNLPKQEKANVVVDLVSQGLVTPEKESPEERAGWRKVDADGNIKQDGEGE